MQITKKLYTTLIIAVLTVSAIMAAIPMASAEITTDPYLVTKGSTTEVTSATPGTQLDVVGNTTSGYAAAFAVVTIYWDSLAGQVLGTGTADNTGSYRITITVPEATAGSHWVIANDGETESGGAPLTVTPKLTVSTTPPTPPPPLVLPGDSLTVTGQGFAANKQITLFLNQTADPTINFTITTPVFTTNATGSFSGTITIPDIDMADFGLFTLNATDASNNTAIASVNIDYYIMVYPFSGPTGIQIMIFGRIAPNVAYDIRFNTGLIATGTTDGAGSYFATYTIPGVLSPAGYEVRITWDSVFRDTTFNVTQPPTILLGASSGVAGDTVTISGENFVPSSDITLYFGSTVVNSTDMDDRFGPTGGFGTNQGKFSEDFVVPSLAPGTYAVKVVDSAGATSAPGVFFTILPTPETTIALRAAVYYPMDIISFNFRTTESDLGTITVTIRDASGAIWWTTDAWTLSGTGIQSVYYQDQVVNGNPMVLPADAPLGTWNWTVTYTPTSTGTLTKATALFSVVARPSMQTLIDQLNANTTTLLEAIETCCDDITALLEALDGKVTAISGNVATVQTTLGSVQTTVSSLGGTISGLSGDIATIKTNLNTIQTTVSSVDAVVGSMYGDVVNIDTALGTIEGTITDMEGTLATIQTDLGTVKLDVATVKADVDESLPVAVDMLPVWIAVILSLIAAIAAIFAVVTIRQKIAG